MDWDFWKSVIAGQARHFLTVAAGALVAHGALQSSQQDAFVQIGVGFVTWAVAAGWSWYQKRETVKAPTPPAPSAPTVKG